MAKFCGNCGAQLEDHAKVCGRCGTPQEDVRIPAVKIVDPERKKKAKKKWRLAAVLIVLAVAAAVGIKVAANFTGYKGLLRKVVAAYEDYDADKLISLSSDVYYYGGEEYAEDYFEGSVDAVFEFFESSVGHNYDLSYETNEIYTLSNHKLNQVLENIEAVYPDFDSGVIEEVAVANLTGTASHGDTSASQDFNIVMSKERDGWKLLYIEWV